MPKDSEFLATILRQSGKTFAGFAAAQMQETDPRASGVESTPVLLWKAWLASRIEELAAAVSLEKPKLFVEQVRWAASPCAARNVPVSNIQRALHSLRGVLARELPENLQSLVRDYLSDAALNFPAVDAVESEELAVDTAQGRLCASYLLAILEGDRRKAASIVQNAMAEGWKVVDLYLSVLAPAQREVGRMWHRDEISIAEEHFATTTTQMIMARLRMQFADQAPNGKTALAAAVPDNHHDVGLQMVADIFEMHGWRTILLGANVPIADFVQAAETFQADLLLLSATLTKHLPAVRDTIQTVRQHGPTRNSIILVGGPAFVGVEDLAAQWGTDGYAPNALEALQLGNRLVGLAN